MKILKLIDRRFNQLKVFNNQKIFCIGDNKTGTTSLTAAMEELGYAIGSQRPAEFLLNDWAERDFKKLIKHCRSAEFFQDFPFSKPFTFIILDQKFPNSKFILTVRDSPEQWYDSLTKFHAQKWGTGGRIPTKEDLQNAFYRWKGQLWEANRYFYTSPESEPYDKHILIKNYNFHNASVIEYFRHKPDSLLVLNVSENGSFKKLCNFLGKEAPRDDFPWKNKTSDIKQR